MADEQAGLMRIKTVLGARLKSGLLYTMFSAEKDHQEYTAGAIWAFQTVLAQLEELELDALTQPGTPHKGSAGERAAALWNSAEQPQEHHPFPKANFRR